VGSRRGRSKWAESEGRIKGVEGWVGGKGGAGAGRLSCFMHRSGMNRAIKLLYAPIPPPPTVWALNPPLWALHLPGLSLANKCVCTHRYAGMHMYKVYG
jgi:hypothetical protein